MILGKCIYLPLGGIFFTGFTNKSLFKDYYFYFFFTKKVSSANFIWLFSPQALIFNSNRYTPAEPVALSLHYHVLLILILYSCHGPCVVVFFTNCTQ